MADILQDPLTQRRAQAVVGAFRLPDSRSFGRRDDFARSLPGVDECGSGLYSPNMARSKEFDPAAALKAATDVFWTHGYAKTSVDDLMAGTSVGRQSLYDTFGDKRSLYLRALNEYRTTTQAAMLELFASSRTIQECFCAILFGICGETRAQHERGCLLLSANLERDADDKDVAAIVRRNQSEVEAIFEGALLNAQQTGQLASSKDPAALASFLLATIQGLRQAARAASNRASLERSARVALSTLT